MDIMDIPEEIFDHILYFVKQDISPIDLYKLKFINSKFYNKINDIKDNYNESYFRNSIDLQNKINRLAYLSDRTITIFKWLFKNNVFLTENNILNLIENNRLDILKECIKHNKINDILFNNKYNMLMFKSQRIIQHESPLILAGNKNNYDIVKFLIEVNNYKNPFHSQLDILIENLLDNNDHTIIKYIITNHYDKLTGKLFTTEKILYGLDNCEDILFYLMLSNKICINNKFILACIDKDYTDICLYAYKHIDKYQTNLSIVAPGEHIERIMKKNNSTLLDYFLSKYPSHINYVMKHLRRMMVSKEFFMDIFNKYLKFIDYDYPIINIYLKYDSNYENIKNLVNNNYIVNEECMIKSLEIPDKRIFKILSEKYLKYNNL